MMIMMMMIIMKIIIIMITMIIRITITTVKFTKIFNFLFGNVLVLHESTVFVD